MSQERRLVECYIGEDGWMNCNLRLRNIHHQIRQQMRDMDRMAHGMLSPFGSLFGMHNAFDSIMGEPSGTRQAHDNMALMDPFGFNFYNGIMRQMENVQAQAMNDPNSHVFSHSTMITFDGRNGGQPRVIEKSIRKTGDVKETRHAIRTGEDGIGDKLTIGHTIGDRTHVIEKKRDRDGRIRERQSFVNLAQDEAESFDREFASRARRNLMGGRSDGYRSRAIESNRYGGTTSNSRSHAPRIGSGTNAPIITLPDEEDDSDVMIEEDYGRGKRSNSRLASGSGGPVIREMTDDDEDGGNNHKRRKGFFGRLFKENDE